MNFNGIRQRLLALDTPSICDANKRIRVLDAGIRLIQPGLKLVGRAHTVTCPDDFLTVIKALKDAEEDEVLVIDTQGSHRAFAGELFATEAARKKLAGIVIDGACRDVQKLRTLNLPVYARFTYPLAGTASKVYGTRVKITCGGVTVNPGDIIFGDDDGVVVASVTELSEVIPIAEEIQHKEEVILKRMEKGESLFEMLNFEEHYANVSNSKESQLKFTVD